MHMSKIRMGVIGVNQIAARHIEGILKSPDGELIALCDINKDQLHKKAKEYGIPDAYCFTNHEDLLRCADVDAVSICTPNDAHHSIALAAIRHNKPFALEKPVTLSANESADLLDKVVESQIKHMVCFSYRFIPAARYLRSVIQSGHLGTIRHVNVKYFQGWARNPDVPLVWRFRKEVTGSGVLGDLGSHMIDMVRFLVGDIEKVCAHTGTFIKERKIPGSEQSGAVDVDDFCNFIGELKGGIPISFETTRYAFGRGNYQHVEIYGDKGGVIYDLANDTDTAQLCIGDTYSNVSDYHAVKVPASFSGNQMQSFFDILNGKSDGLPAGLADGHYVQTVLDAVIRSAEIRQWIDV